MHIRKPFLQGRIKLFSIVAVCNALLKNSMGGCRKKKSRRGSKQGTCVTNGDREAPAKRRALFAVGNSHAATSQE